MKDDQSNQDPKCCQKGKNTHLVPSIIDKRTTQEGRQQSVRWTMDSSDEALCEMLGLSSLDAVTSNQETKRSNGESPFAHGNDGDERGGRHTGGHGRDRPTIQAKVDSLGLANLYRSTSYCVLPKTLSLSAQHMRQITDGLV